MGRRGRDGKLQWWAKVYDTADDEMCFEEGDEERVVKQKVVGGADGLNLEDERFEKLRQTGYSAVSRKGSLMATDLPQQKRLGEADGLKLEIKPEQTQGRKPVVLAKAVGTLGDSDDDESGDVVESSSEDCDQTPMGSMGAGIVEVEGASGAPRRGRALSRPLSAAGSSATRARSNTPRAGEAKSAEAAAEAVQRGRALLHDFSQAADIGAINEVRIASGVAQLRHAASIVCKTSRWKLVDECNAVEKAGGASRRTQRGDSRRVSSPQRHCWVPTRPSARNTTR